MQTNFIRWKGRCLTNFDGVWLLQVPERKNAVGGWLIRPGSPHWESLVV
jgi:hypothetical protein